ncbi:hypothetical protein TNCV_3643231 [Trichonephila clavipes]|nr:hypothetical protein TNCV_3643231 [Trichonephila clavipes]
MAGDVEYHGKRIWTICLTNQSTSLSPRVQNAAHSIPLCCVLRFSVHFTTELHSSRPTREAIARIDKSKSSNSRMRYLQAITAGIHLAPSLHLTFRWG